jgi:lipoprotein-anchoring transpeptidase ErfK/SrfK
MSKINHLVRCVGAGMALACAALWTSEVQSQVLAVTSEASVSASFNPAFAARGNVEETSVEMPARLRRQTVDYPTSEAPGTVLVDTPNTYLYFVLGGGKAIRYGIGVGREGFTWSGVKTIERKLEWPDWVPPMEMLQRQPYLPRFMAGGPGNPLGARAMYLGGTVYRIHGTNAPATIGKQVSSGCIRMTNEDVADLYEHTHVGTKVVVLPMPPQAISKRVQVTPRHVVSISSSRLY